MSYRRNYIDAEIAKATEMIAEDESWQTLPDDPDRALLLHFATAYVRAYAYRQQSPRVSALRVLKMLRAAAAAVADETPQSLVQSALSDSGKTNDDNDT